MIGMEYITPKGNQFVVTAETGRLFTCEIMEGPLSGLSIDVPKDTFRQLVDCGHYREMLALDAEAVSAALKEVT